MSSYPIPCYADMQRAVPADSGAGTRSYWVMPSNTTIWNFSIFRDRAQEELIYFWIPAAMFSMMFHWLMCRNFFITFWLFVFISAYVSIKNRFFRTLPTWDNYIYQMRKRNVMQFCLLIPKHLIIQLAKLHIDILNWNTTFRHCKKIPITFEQGCILYDGQSQQDSLECLLMLIEFIIRAKYHIVSLMLIIPQGFLYLKSYFPLC